MPQSFVAATMVVARSANGIGANRFDLERPL